MNTKAIMTVTAGCYAIIGTALTFIPDEISAEKIPGLAASPILFQLLGAGYLGFAFMNMMVRGSIIGGIYNRPIVIGNLTHFTIGGIAILKIVNGTGFSYPLLCMGLAFCAFAVVFGVIMMKNPKLR